MKNKEVDTKVCANVSVRWTMANFIGHGFPIAQPRDGTIMVPYDSLKLRFRQTPIKDLVSTALEHNLRSLKKKGTTSAPTVPYSTAELLYGNDLSKPPKVEDDPNLLSYGCKDRIQTISDLDEQTFRRPSSKGGLLNSRAIDRASYKRELEETLRPGNLLPSATKNSIQYRQNGLRSSLIKGEPLFSSSRSNVSSSGRNSDELIAMGTIWSPNSQSQPKPNNTSSNSIPNNMNNSLVAPSKSIPMSTASSSSSTTGLTGQPIQQKTRYNNTVRPIMVNTRSNSKDVEPKYTDPVIGATASFQQRLMELSALEAETIRYERNKKVKKKVKQDRDS